MTTVKLDQSSFNKGTYRIKDSGKYILTENIIFNPSPSTLVDGKLIGPDWMPNKEQLDQNGDYPGIPHGPYHLGWFAAITIESDDVEIDLGGFCISQSLEHYLQQRFFNTIELAQSPFIRNQGPSDFGPFQSYNNIKIYNGILGLSSHSSIHGNGPSNLLLSDLTCIGFEQSAMTINGGTNITVQRVNIGSNSKNVLVRATYSQARFIRSFLNKIIDHSDPSININGTNHTGTDILNELQKQLDTTFNEIINQNIAPTSKTFKHTKDDTCSDGAIYGCVFNTLGAVVGPFLTTREEGKGNTGIKLYDLNIGPLSSCPVEIPALCVEENHNLAQRGPVGDVIRIAECTDTNGKYIPDVLTNAQMYVSKYGHLINKNPQASVSLYNDWISGTSTLDEIITAQKICYIYGRDAMSHIMKGNIGIFLSGAKDVVIKDVNISGLKNKGSISEHLKDTYDGNRTRGVAIVASQDIEIIDINIKDTLSRTSDAACIDILSDSSNIKLIRPKCFNPQGGTIDSTQSYNNIIRTKCIRYVNSDQLQIINDIRTVVRK